MVKEVAKYDNDIMCTVCVQAKQTRLPFKTERMRTSKVLQIPHSDVCGPLDVDTHNGKRYFQTVLNDFSHFCVAFLLSNKGELAQCLKNYVQAVENQFDQNICTIKCDNEGEHRGKNFRQWCLGKGRVLCTLHSSIKWCSKKVEHDASNGTRSLILDAELPKEMWGEDVQTSAYILNRTPTETVKNTPVEIWIGRKPTVKF